MGAAAHIIAQVAVWQGREVYALTRPGDVQAQVLAMRMGCAWAGDSTAVPPAPLDAAIIFAAVGALVPAALRATAKGGCVVCAGIHMSAEVKKEKEEKKDDKVLCSERYQGMVSRSFQLPSDIDEAKAAAAYKDGALELTLPKKAGSKARQLSVQ